MAFLDETVILRIRKIRQMKKSEGEESERERESENAVVALRSGRIGNRPFGSPCPIAYCLHTIQYNYTHC